MRQKAERFPPDFFTRYDTGKLARALLGQKLVTSSGGALTSGMIVEVEGYLNIVRGAPSDSKSMHYRPSLGYPTSLLGELDHRPPAHIPPVVGTIQAPSFNYSQKDISP